jgi:hypothetical protein
MESNKQEKYDLLHDNPVAKDASGGRGGSWMSKHAAQSRMSGGSPLNKVKPEAKPTESEWSEGTFDPYGDTNPFDTK